MVSNTSFDQIDLPGYEQIGPDSTLFEDGATFDLHQKYGTPNRTGIELARTLRRIDEQRQDAAIEKREATPDAYEQMRGRGEWIIYMRKDRINSIQPVTSEEFIGREAA